MANVKISALPAVTTVVPGSDVLPLVSGGITTKATPNAIVQAVLPAPGAIGGTTPGSGAFTTLSASSTVSGTGFSNYLASPPAIGGTAAAAGSFTNLSYTGTFTGSTGVLNIGSGQIYKDASGNVGIGTSSPLQALDIANGNLTLSTSGSSKISLFKSASAFGFTGPILFSYDTAGLGIGTPGASPIVFGTNNIERMRLDSSGNLGLGVTPSAWGNQGKALQIGAQGSFAGYQYSSSNNQVWFGNNCYTDQSTAFKYIASNPTAILRIVNDGSFQWQQAASGTAGNAISFTQAMTLDASGRLYVKQTSQSGNTLQRMGLTFDGSVEWGINITTTSNSGSPINFTNASGTQIGRIDATSTTVIYLTTSDERLKTNITPAESAIQSILDFPVDQFDWISSGEHQDFGAVAQKAINVIPEMVSVPADPDEMWGIDWSKAVPRLIKTIQELTARLEALENK